MPLHEIPPVWTKDSKVLILGSFPSVRSREAGFYYAHPRNRFWQLLPLIYGETVPQTTDEKISLLLSHHLALWDVVHSCGIDKSSDATIRNVQPNDVPSVIRSSHIGKVICNGQTAGDLYRRLIEPESGITALVLPSTSPANASWTLERLASRWAQALL